MDNSFAPAVMIDRRTKLVIKHWGQYEDYNRLHRLAVLQSADLVFFKHRFDYHTQIRDETIGTRQREERHVMNCACRD